MSDDVLTATLAHFGMDGVFYCVSEMNEPWGTLLPPMPGTVMFHLLTEGRAVVDIDGDRIDLAVGDLLLIPHGAGHTIRSSGDAPATPLFDHPRIEVADNYERIRIDGEGASATLICGALAFTDLAVGRMMASLPSVLRAEQGTGWLRAVLDVMADECRSPAAGSAVVTARLADVLVVHTVRAWLERADPQRGWVAGVRDPHLGRALTAFHTDPARRWDLPALAAEAGLSRTAFAARFSEMLGESPMAYVTSWRMDLAAALLEEGELTAARVAARVGYTSEAAFSRAFRRLKGTTPGRWRRISPLESILPA